MSVDRCPVNRVDDAAAVDLIVADEPTIELNIRFKLCIWLLPHIDTGNKTTESKHNNGIFISVQQLADDDTHWPDTLRL